MHSMVGGVYTPEYLEWFGGDGGWKMGWPLHAGQTLNSKPYSSFHFIFHYPCITLIGGQEFLRDPRSRGEEGG